MQNSAKMDFVEQIGLYAKNFINYNKLTQKSNTTINNYTNLLNKLLDYSYSVNDSIRLNNINKSHITNFFLYLDEINIKINKKALSVSTKAQYLTILKIFFKFITKNNDELLDLDNVLDDFRFKEKKKEKIEHFFKSDERDKVLAFVEKKFLKYPSLKNARHSLLVKFMLLAGLRVSEALSLRFCDFQISSDDEFFDINILAKGGNYQNAFVKKEQIQEEFDMLKEEKNLNDFVFGDENNKPMLRQNVYLTLKRIYRKCGIFSKSGCHILRHSYAMNFVENNTNLSIVQKALRHKNIQTTMIYANSTNELVKNEIKRLGMVQKGKSLWH